MFLPRLCVPFDFSCGTMHRNSWHLGMARLLAAVLFLLSALAFLAGEPRFFAAEAPAPSVQESTPESVTPAYADPLQARLQHLARLGADRWHAAGYRGRGVKIAILDTGFRGYRAYLGRGLAGQVTVQSFRTGGKLEAKDSQHAILCGEGVRALAPDAAGLPGQLETD